MEGLQYPKRVAFLEAYKQVSVTRPFLSNWFKTRPQDIVDAESVEIEVKRGDMRIAPVVSETSQEGGKIKRSQYTSKKMTPPTIIMSSDVAATDLEYKEFGKTKYEQTSAEMRLMNEVGESTNESDQQVIRNIEYQASQILQTGKASLHDADGKVGYDIDYKPKATHFPTVGADWADPNTNPDDDIASLSRVIKADGKVVVKHIIFGKNALKKYMDNPKTKEKFDNRRIESGAFKPEEIFPDATCLGELLIGTTYYVAWQYDALYIDPEDPDGKKLLPFVDDNSVILLPEQGGLNVDFRMPWCRVPTVTGSEDRFKHLFPSQMKLDNRQYTFRVYADYKADKLVSELKARPLCIPVSIDAFGCLDTDI